MTSHEQIRVLVVDDEPDVAEVVSGHLRFHDLAVEVCHEGKAVLERVVVEDRAARGTDGARVQHVRLRVVVHERGAPVDLARQIEAGAAPASDDAITGG